MSFKYVSIDNIGYTAGDADTLTALAFGNLSPGSLAISAFRIGNTGSSTTNFTVSAASVNDLLDSFAISYGGETYTLIGTGITISGIEANAITDRIYIAFDVPEDAFISEGTIRITVSET
jgi:hypothetical protein